MHQAAKMLVDKLVGVRIKATQKFELGTESLTAAGAASVSVPATFITSSGAIAITLANGYEGQLKYIILVSDGGTATVTPTSFGNGTTITLDTDYDDWLGIFHAGSWWTVGTPKGTVS